MNQTEADFWNMVVQQKVEVSFTDLLLRIYSSVCSVFYVDVFLAFVGIFIEKILILLNFDTSVVVVRQCLKIFLVIVKLNIFLLDRSENI